jgi:hypothetical protein
MLKSRSFKGALFVCILLLTVVACQVNSKQMYYNARVAFNETLAQYLPAYDAQPAQVQEQWKLKVDPWFVRAEALLDAWGSALDAGEDGLKQQAAYSRAKDDLIDILFIIYKEVKHE